MCHRLEAGFIIEYLVSNNNGKLRNSSLEATHRAPDGTIRSDGLQSIRTAHFQEQLGLREDLIWATKTLSLISSCVQNIIKMDNLTVLLLIQPKQIT